MFKNAKWKELPEEEKQRILKILDIPFSRWFSAKSMYNGKKVWNNLPVEDRRLIHCAFIWLMCIISFLILIFPAALALEKLIK